MTATQQLLFFDQIRVIHPWLRSHRKGHLTFEKVTWIWFTALPLSLLLCPILGAYYCVGLVSEWTDTMSNKSPSFYTWQYWFFRALLFVDWIVFLHRFVEVEVQIWEAIHVVDGHCDIKMTLWVPKFNPSTNSRRSIMPIGIVPPRLTIAPIIALHK